jgi:hypothetical protein
LYQSSLDLEILYDDRSLRDKQLLIRPFLRKSKNSNMADGLKSKLTFRFMDRTHEPLYLRKLSFVH